MWYAHRYRAYPDRTGATADAECHIDIHRQLYNHVKYDYENSPADDKPSEYAQNNKLPEFPRQPLLAEWSEENWKNGRTSEAARAVGVSECDVQPERLRP